MNYVGCWSGLYEQVTSASLGRHGTSLVGELSQLVRSAPVYVIGVETRGNFRHRRLRHLSEHEISTIGDWDMLSVGIYREDGSRPSISLAINRAAPPGFVSICFTTDDLTQSGPFIAIARRWLLTLSESYRTAFGFVSRSVIEAGPLADSPFEVALEINPIERIRSFFPGIYWHNMLSPNQVAALGGEKGLHTSCRTFDVRELPSGHWIVQLAEDVYGVQPSQVDCWLNVMRPLIGTIERRGREWW